MNRRSFLLGVTASGAVLGTAGAVLLGGDSNSRPLTIDASLQTLDQLMSGNAETLGDWNLYQILVHCAQSVEFSMSRFPEHKPTLFKNTVGKLAFTVFSEKEEMYHGLSEAIPGAPFIAKNDDITYAYQRFKDSMIKFRRFKGPLAQHFAYGSLTKLEYEKAHAMHFYNHLMEITFTS